VHTLTCVDSGTNNLWEVRKNMVDESMVCEALGPLRPPEGTVKDLALASRRPSVRCVRLNLFGQKAFDAEPPFPTRPVPWLPVVGRFLVDPVRPSGHLLYAAGAYYIQDAGSLLAIAAMDIRPGQLICDVCASPGGKATAILDRLGRTGGLLANEAIRSRLAPLLLNLGRHGSGRFSVTGWDPETLSERLAGRFDAVLVDAPCSGQSLVGKGKQTSRAYAPRTMAHCAARQKRILRAAASLVRPGGYLVYSTCTFAWTENEQQVIDLTQYQEGWRIEPVEVLRPWQSPAPSPEGCYRLWPHLDDSAGAFACRLRRDTSAELDVASIRVRDRSSCIPVDVGRWRSPVVVRSTPTRTDAWSESTPPLLSSLDAHGPEVAYRKGKTWFPAYALATRREGDFSAYQTLDLSDRESAAYLRGEAIANATTGWVVVTWRSWPLGWAYGSGRQLANHLPISARIRVDTF